MTPYELAKKIDHTLLKPEATTEQIEKLCCEALEYLFASVCVNSVYVQDCRRLIPADSEVLVCSVVGFPFGAMAHEVKAEEATYAVVHGAQEVDMVADLGAIMAGNWDRLRSDIQTVRRAVSGSTLKVILETSLIGLERAAVAADICAAEGADFVKTSTGFHASGGATADAVRTLASAVHGRAQVKASGGIRDTDAALDMIEAGANRIGASSGIAILDGLKISR
jgi:deoxyribose-phosphate aldolase